MVCGMGGERFEKEEALKRGERKNDGRKRERERERERRRNGRPLPPPPNLSSQEGFHLALLCRIETDGMQLTSL